MNAFVMRDCKNEELPLKPEFNFWEFFENLSPNWFGSYDGVPPQ
jgi:hypothetical protein